MLLTVRSSQHLKNNITLTKDMDFGQPETAQSQDRLVYKAYEDRADNEAVDDNAIKGSLCLWVTTATRKIWSSTSRQTVPVSQKTRCIA